MSLNIHDIINIVELVQEINYIDSIVFGAVTAPFANQDLKLIEENSEYWFEKKQYEHLWPKDKNKIKKVYSKLIELKNKGYKISNHEHRLNMQLQYFTNPKKRLENAVCNVNRNLIIEQNGDVFHCNIKKEKIGNITKGSIANIWNSFHSAKMRRRILKCKANCHELINCDSTDSKYGNKALC
jgi:radical SAM protein with 4Fe4S-binding SPASM domain